MPNQIPPPSPEINRLKAAAALIPIIESGLLASKLSVERAALMASFCEWTIENVPDDPEVVTLAEIAGGGLKRIKVALPLAGEERLYVVSCGTGRRPSPPTEVLGNREQRCCLR